jgi:hypothetical protein
MKKKTILALSSAVVVGLLAVSLVSVTALEWAKAEGNATSCAKIEFGTTTNNNASELGTDTSKFSVSGMTINSISSTKVYCSTLGEAAKLGSSSAGGSLTVTFDSLLITSIRLFAFEYSTSEGTAGITVQTSALAAAQDGSVSNSAAPDLTALSGTGIYLFSGLDGGTGTSSTSLTIASPSKRFYLSKILLTIKGAKILPKLSLFSRERGPQDGKAYKRQATSSDLGAMSPRFALRRRNEDAPRVKKDGTARIRVPSMGCFIFVSRRFLHEIINRFRDSSNLDQIL